MDKAKVKLRYALGRSNHCDGTEDVYGCKYGTSKFHVNPYFNTVTAIQMSKRQSHDSKGNLANYHTVKLWPCVVAGCSRNRLTRILWIEPKR